MLSKINRVLQDWFRPKRLAIGRYFWDRKDNKIENIDMDKVKKILFLRYDGKIGDMIINTFMFREIKKVYPDIEIGVVARGANRQVIENNPNVDKIYEYDKNSKKIKSLAKKIKEENYDLLIDFSEMLRVNQMKFINLCEAVVNMGLNKTDWNLFDVSVEYGDREKHITNRYKEYLEILGVKNPNLSYDINLSEKDEYFGKIFRETIKEKKLICINPYGASKYRTLNKEKVKEIVELILKEKDTAITFVYSPDKLVKLKKILEEIDSERVYLNENICSILDTASIIKVSDLIITPDTSIVHLGVALDKKMVAIYRSDEGSGDLNSIVWGANSVKVKQIYAKPSLIENEEADINEFHVEEIEIS
jgi:ADP-heptose:LPS heptosyltransferase